MIADSTPLFVVASLGLVCHNSDGGAADRLVCLFRKPKLCHTGNRSFSCSAIFIVEIQNLFSWMSDGDISVNMASTDDGSEDATTSCVWFVRENENVHGVWLPFLNWEILRSDCRSIAHGFHSASLFIS